MQEVSINAAIEFLHGHLSGYVKFDGERTEYSKDIYPKVEDFIRTVQARLYS